MEVNAFALARFLDPQRYRPFFLSPWVGNFSRREIPAGLKVFSPLRLRGIRGIVRWLKGNRIDIVHSYGFQREGALAALKANLPHLRSSGNFWKTTRPDLPPQVRLRIFREIAFIDPTLIVPSSSIERSFKKLGWFRVFKIPHGIDTKPFELVSPSVRERFRKSLGLPLRCKVAAMVGNFYEAKRHLDFLKAGALLAQANPEVYLVIAGQPLRAPDALRARSKHYLHTVCAFAKRRGLNGHLRITHFSDRGRPAFFQGIDLLLSPSIEGFGLAMAEAMAAGRPVISVDQGGSCDLIEDGETGRLVPVGNPRRMAETALELLEDERLARRMGADAVRRIRVHFNIQQQVKRTQALYDRVLDGDEAAWVRATP